MINKASLIREIKKTTGIPLRDASMCIDVIFDVIAEAVSRGERIELRGFGSFLVREIKSKKTGVAFIPTHGRIYFRPCQKLRMSAWNRVKN